MEDKNILVFLPTYNEKENISSIIEEILSSDLPVGILVVDDQSPDGTGEIVEELTQKYSQVDIIHRPPPRGRGRGGIDGLKYASNQPVEYIIEMDADFSHHPKYIPMLVDACKNGDVVIGSRYVKGGGVEGWGLNRKINSAVANLISKILFGFKVKDSTSGYRCYKREVLASLDWNNMISVGPSIVEEVLYKIVRQKKWKVVEIPIIFKDRTEGKSKISLIWILRWIRNLLEVRLQKQSKK